MTGYGGKFKISKAVKFEAVFEKIYKAKDVVKNRGVPLGFSVWPDIKIDNWDQYFFFYDGNAQVNILPKNIFSIKDIRNKLENLTSDDKIKFINKDF